MPPNKLVLPGWLHVENESFFGSGCGCLALAGSGLVACGLGSATFGSGLAGSCLVACFGSGCGFGSGCFGSACLVGCLGSGCFACFGSGCFGSGLGSGLAALISTGKPSGPIECLTWRGGDGLRGADTGFELDAATGLSVFSFGLVGFSLPLSGENRASNTPPLCDNTQCVIGTAERCNLNVT